jgi:hypothetical protein
LIVRVAFRPLMEHNLFSHCSVKGSGNASFSFNTNYALWQYNEACFTKYNTGDEDAGGFDSDYNSKYTTLQYNYSHDNGYGAILLTGGPGDGFNDGTVIRYNVLANNSDHVIRTSGGATNSSIYNNTIYSRVGLSSIALAWHKSWEGYASNTRYYNNIFQVMGSGASFDLGSSSGNLFDYNIFYGSTITNEPADAHKLKTNPMLVLPDSTGTVPDSMSVYRVRQFSPAINSAMFVTGGPVKDIEGNVVPTYGLADRGAFEYTGPTGIADEAFAENILLYPNPATDYFILETGKLPSSVVSVQLFALDGKMLMNQDYSIQDRKIKIKIMIQPLALKTGMYLVRVQSGSRFVKDLPLYIQ